MWWIEDRLLHLNSSCGFATSASLRSVVGLNIVKDYGIISRYVGQGWLLNILF